MHFGLSPYRTNAYQPQTRFTGNTAKTHFSSSEANTKSDYEDLEKLVLPELTSGTDRPAMEVVRKSLKLRHLLALADRHMPPDGGVQKLLVYNKLLKDMAKKRLHLTHEEIFDINQAFNNGLRYLEEKGYIEIKSASESVSLTEKGQRGLSAMFERHGDFLS